MEKSENPLEEKLKSLNKRSDELAVELQRKFTPATYRVYNITRHKIQVTEQRIDGLWQPSEQVRIDHNLQRQFNL